jgi:hypothetical protein
MMKLRLIEDTELRGIAYPKDAVIDVPDGLGNRMLVAGIASRVSDSEEVYVPVKKRKRRKKADDA